VDGVHVPPVELTERSDICGGSFGEGAVVETFVREIAVTS
jgi:hypothetical protein